MPSLALRLGGVVWLAVALIGCGGGGGAPPAPTSQTPAPTVSPPPTPPPPPPPNNPPFQTTPDGSTSLQLSARVPIRLDTSMGGTVFSDPDGDPLTYKLYWNDKIIGDGPWLSLAAGDPAKPWDPDNLIGGAFYVSLRAYDPQGAMAEHLYIIERFFNRAPVVNNPNAAVFPAPNESVSRDLLQGGTTFVDPDGDPLTYSVDMIAPPGQNIGVQGTNVEGALGSAGLAARFTITASDNFGETGTDTFIVATAVPAPGDPSLPAASFVYADADLPLPSAFRSSALIREPFWDTAVQPDYPGVPSNAGATLGRVLFYDKRISVTNTLACGSCHVQSLGFTTAQRFPIGVLGTSLKRNAMALANVRYNFHEKWFSDLRADRLEDLVLMPMQDPTELGNVLPLIVQKLSATDFYPQLFEAAFGTREITPVRISRALAQFLRSIITYRSLFDRAYLPMDGPPAPAPDPTQFLSAEELRGADLFVSSHCADCHKTALQTLDGGALNNGLDAVFSDPGAGFGAFRATSLRNIAVTAPYMHDGRFATLREVIDHYDHGVVDSPSTSDVLRDDSLPGRPIRQLNLAEADKVALEAFLRTLTDYEMLTDPKFSDPF